MQNYSGIDYFIVKFKKYKVFQIISTLASDSRIVLKNYKLYSAFPNPFNPSTKIQYSLPIRGKVDLRVFDLQGRLVNKLVSSIQDPGLKTVEWNGKDDLGNSISSGVYFYKIVSNNYVDSKKVIYIK